MNRDDVLTTAQELISRDRAQAYGDAKDNFTQIASLWKEVFGWDADASKVALAMVLVKAARLSTSIGHGDSWVDIAGYAALGGEISYQQPEPPKVEANTLPCHCGKFRLREERGAIEFLVTSHGKHYATECKTSWVCDDQESEPEGGSGNGGGGAGDVSD